MSRAANEIHLPANARIDPMTDGIRADLSRQIDLQGGIDGNDTLILSNQRRVVGVIAG